MHPELSFSPDKIETECQRLGHALGWRLLTCPERNIWTAKIALITINPGGFEFEPAKWSVEAGSAYVVERWRSGHPPGESPLQRQIRRMFEILNVKPEDALSGYLVPFRSRSWNELREKKASRDFGIRVWSDILGLANPEIVIAFGKDIANDVAMLLGATNCRQYRANWGEQTIDQLQFGESGKLLVLPHLSRFALFHRSQSEDAFRNAVSGRTE